MLKKTITYTDFNDVERTEDFYFNLSKAELVEMELSETGGLGEAIKKLVKEEDSKKIIDTFKSIILDSIGEKSADGKRFVKNDEIRDNFRHSEAYSELFVELATDAEAGSKFITGVVPAGLDNPDTLKQLSDHKKKADNS